MVEEVWVLEGERCREREKDFFKGPFTKVWTRGWRSQQVLNQALRRWGLGPQGEQVCAQQGGSWGNSPTSGLEANLPGSQWEWGVGHGATDAIPKVWGPNQEY